MNGSTGQPAVDATPDAAEEQLTKPAETLPDEPASEVAQLKAERDELTKQAQAFKDEKAALEQRLKDNQEYISRTRKVEKEMEVAKPQKTLDDYLNEVSEKFENDPKEGLKKVIRDIAYDRDLERQEYEKRAAAAEERAFKKMLALNPESSKALKEIEKLDAECPDLQGLSFERKMEFARLRNIEAAKQTADTRGRIDREVDIAGGVSGGITGGRERIPSWVNDPEVVREARGKFGTKQELLDWADPDKAKAMYERELAKQRTG